MDVRVPEGHFVAKASMYFSWKFKGSKKGPLAGVQVWCGNGCRLCISIITTRALEASFEHTVRLVRFLSQTLEIHIRWCAASVSENFFLLLFFENQLDLQIWCSYRVSLQSGPRDIADKNHHQMECSSRSSLPSLLIFNNPRDNWSNTYQHTFLKNSKCLSSDLQTVQDYVGQ